MIYKITSQVSIITTQVQKDTRYNPKYKSAHVRMEIREPKRSVGHDRSRAGQPALLDKPSPQWKAPLRSRPPNLNMQIQGSRHNAIIKDSQVAGIMNRDNEIVLSNNVRQEM